MEKLNLIEELKKHGKVTVKLHPEHLDKIFKIHEESQEDNNKLANLLIEYKKIRRRMEALSARIDVHKDEFWESIIDSFDTELSEAYEFSSGATFDKENASIDIKTATYIANNDLDDVSIPAPVRHALKSTKEIMDIIFGKDKPKL